ncbi:MAG: 5'-3' exoribonuclease [Chlamydiae bacterium]|nr:5'-3' exoribonuclease [Chlamydiota bacterium]
MNEFRADLHCHTICSDGSLSPTELLEHAKKIGLSGLSITDHDTVAAYKEAIPVARRLGLLLGSGVEFSSMWEGMSVHVLGYDIDLKSSPLLELCVRHIERRRDRNRAILKKLHDRGYELSVEELEKKMVGARPIGRPHIALALIEKGYVSTVQEAFDKLLGDKAPCFDPGSPITTDETIEVIHAAGGKAFIAHPHVIREKERIQMLLEKPFDGIEVYYSKFLPHQEKRWEKCAKKRCLLMSGGSDFHGEVKPSVPLGASWVDQKTFEQIFQKRL